MLHCGPMRPRIRSRRCRLRQRRAVGGQHVTATLLLHLAVVDHRREKPAVPVVGINLTLTSRIRPIASSFDSISFPIDSSPAGPVPCAFSLDRSFDSFGWRLNPVVFNQELREATRHPTLWQSLGSFVAAGKLFLASRCGMIQFRLGSVSFGTLTSDQKRREVGRGAMVSNVTAQRRAGPEVALTNIQKYKNCIGCADVNYCTGRRTWLQNEVLGSFQVGQRQLSGMTGRLPARTG